MKHTEIGVNTIYLQETSYLFKFIYAFNGGSPKCYLRLLLESHKKYSL